jgi:hypothetical protein
MNYVLKMDYDFHLPKKYQEWFRKSKKGLLYAIGFEVSYINIEPSDKRGFHAWVGIKSKKKLTPHDLIVLQLLCGSDTSREFINLARLKRKIPFFRSNKLFSKVIYRRDSDFERKRAYQINKKIKSKIDRDNLKATLDRLFALENFYRKLMKEGRKNL